MSITFEVNLPLDNKLTRGKDKTITLANMTWDDYQTITQENQGYRISFFEGVISIMSPSRNHERIAQTISILINAYCRQYNIDYFSLGSSDIKTPPIAGKQPDVSYCFEIEKETPDLAVEVVFSSGGIKDLDKYKILQVKEIWFWRNNKIEFYWLENSEYKLINLSRRLTRLEAQFLNKFVNSGLTESHLAIERNFIAQLQKEKGL